MFLKRDLWDGFWHSVVEIGALIFQKLLLKVSSLSTSSEHSNREREREIKRQRQESLICVSFQHFAYPLVVCAQDSTVVIFVSRSPSSLGLIDRRCGMFHYITHPFPCFPPAGDFFTRPLVNRTPYWIRHIATFGKEESGQFPSSSQVNTTSSKT